MNLEKILVSSKNLVRTGWMQHGIPPAIGETVASHSFEAAILAYEISNELLKLGVKVNPDRASVIALFHDIAESIMGDLPRWTTQSMNKTEKINLEIKAIKELNANIELYEEYYKGLSIEGRIARLSDKLSTCLQAIRYKKMGFNVDDIISSSIREIEEILNDGVFVSIKEKVFEIIKSTENS
ncbi:MAG: HD family hydrolase [Sulfolobaceae archaeon]